MNDPKKRQDVNRLIDKVMEDNNLQASPTVWYCLYQIKDILSAEQKGKWIFNPSDAIEVMFTKPKCSKCGFESADGGNYCSNCGARMEWRGEEDV